jgi:hypothetical protein
MFKINNTPVFEIVFRGTHAIPGRNNYKARTLKSATDKLAWWMVFDKYGRKLDYGSPSPFGGDIVDNTRTIPFGIECDCADGEEWDGPDWVECPVHDRHDGYLARVKERLSRVLYLHADHHVGRHTIDNKGRLLAGEPELILVSDSR